LYKLLKNIYIFSSTFLHQIPVNVFFISARNLSVILIYMYINIVKVVMHNEKSGKLEPSIFFILLILALAHFGLQIERLLTVLHKPRGVSFLL